MPADEITPMINRSWNTDNRRGRSLTHRHKATLFSTVRDNPRRTIEELIPLVDQATKTRGLPRITRTKLDVLLRSMQDNGELHADEPGSAKWARWTIVSTPE